MWLSDTQGAFFLVTATDVVNGLTEARPGSDLSGCFGASALGAARPVGAGPGLLGLKP